MVDVRVIEAAWLYSYNGFYSRRIQFSQIVVTSSTATLAQSVFRNARFAVNPQQTKFTSTVMWEIWPDATSGPLRHMCK